MKSVYRVASVDLDRVEKLLIKALLIGVGIGAIIACIIMGIIFKIVYDGQTETHARELSVYVTRLTNLSQEHDRYIQQVETQIADAVEVYKVQEREYLTEIGELNTEIDNLNARIDALNEEKVYEFEQLRQFWYVFKNAPANSGLTVDHLLFSIEQGKLWGVSPRLMWAIYDVESDFNPRCDSTSGSSARGLGQTLESTAREIWEKVLGHGSGSYNHNMAYDPYVNIEISTCLMGRNLAQGTLEDAIWLYGDRTESYYGYVTSAATNHGFTLNENTARKA